MSSEPDQTGFSRRALEAVLGLAAEHGLQVTQPEILRDRGNVVIHLKPSPVVARVAALTGQVRADRGLGWLNREISVLKYLTATNGPAVRISPLIAPGPFSYNGLVLSFIEWVRHDPARSLTPYELGQSLAGLHASLRDCPLDLPRLTPVAELKHWLALAKEAGSFETPDYLVLQEIYNRAEDRLLNSVHFGQIIHGDAHAGNLLHTERGAIWNDFEETCFGPPEWDLACMLNKDLAFGTGELSRQVLAGYATNLTATDLMPFVEARMLEAVLWVSFLAKTDPTVSTFIEQYLGWLRTRI